MNYQTHQSRRSPPNYRGGGGGGGPHRPFDSPPRHSPGGFRPLVVAGPAGGGFGSNHQDPPPLSGQKRGLSRGGSPDRFDRAGFAKLFVGSVPRTVTEEDIRPLFEEHGEVIEVALIKDKKTGQQQGTLRGRLGQAKAHLSSQFVFATSFTLVGFACNLFFMSVLSKKKKARYVNQLITSVRIAVGILEDT